LELTIKKITQNRSVPRKIQQTQTVTPAWHMAGYRRCKGKIRELYKTIVLDCQNQAVVISCSGCIAFKNCELSKEKDPKR
jgi:hypothetical protein